MSDRPVTLMVGFFVFDIFFAFRHNKINNVWR